MHSSQGFYIFLLVLITSNNQKLSSQAGFEQYFSNSDLFQLVKRDEIEREEYKKMLEEEQKKIAAEQFNMIQTQMTAHIEKFNLRVSKS